MPTNHGSIEWLKFPDPDHPGDDTRLIKKWLRDSWARRKIVALQQTIAAIVVPIASTANPQMDGTAAPGSSTDYARADHVHPHDTSKADVATTYTKTEVDAMIPAAGLVIPYGYCTTAAATVAKAVTVSPAVTSLETGLTIAVKFQYANTGSNPTLNVNSLGAKAIKRYGSTAAGTSAAANWNANSVVMLTYDGTYWMLVDWNNTTYSGMTDAEYQAGTGTSNRLITPARLKAAILLHAPVQSVNGATGAVSLTASDVGALPSSTTIPSATSDLTNDSGFITAAAVPDASSATPAMDGTGAAGSSTDYSRADHVHPSDTSKADVATTLAGYGITNAYTKTEVDGMIPTVPTNVSAFTNDAGYLTSAPVTSVNSQTGAVNLTASDVGALPSGTAIPSKTSDLTNDSGFITGEKFAVITCTLASSNTYGAYTALPTGFTKDNCVMLTIQVPDGSGERIGEGIFTTTNMRLFAEMTTSGVRIYNNTSRYYGVDVKVALMRTDI